ncbi:GNAT family N-acetyltransferase [Thioclava sp. 'Guangxiensis']|uniref:GNAT family N-acetyltransferase n=1 Tax=Thioclava sp. 'Guangxiensis' TaxID=3149044 RepID=UPI003877A0BB
MHEMVAFYTRPLAVKGDLAADIVRQSENVQLVVATEGEDIIGFVSFGILYPVAGLQSFAYLQQIYVAEAHRRKGCAEILMAFVAQSCISQGYDWMEWMTGSDNTPAQRFYKGLGAVPANKVAFELSGDALKALAARSSPTSE